jgi:hypothetical protein
MKKIYNNDVSLVFANNVWTTGTVYDYYTDNQDLNDLDYFVVTQDNHVFKCIDNNYGAASTVEPAPEDPNSPQLDILTTSDGYRWKYLFTVPSYLIRKFKSDNFLPISSNTNVLAAAVPGDVNKIEIVDGGSGYGDTIDVPIFIQGDGGVNNSAIINITNVDANGAIQTGGFTFVERGTNYIFDNTVTSVPVRIQQIFDSAGQIVDENTFESAYGIANINTTTGGIVNLTITQPGNGYQLASARIVQSSAYAYGTTNSSGEITTITNVFSGSNFREALAIPVTDTTPTTEANLRPIISPEFGHGGNPEKELNVRSLAFSVYTVFDENGDFSTQNDFRTVGVIIDPVSSSTLQPAKENSLNAKYTITLNEAVADQFDEDEIIAGATSESEGLFIDYLDANTIRIIKRSNADDFRVGESIIGESSTTTATIASIQEPEVIPYSGEIILINNGISFERSEFQIESTTFIISF